VNRRQRWAARSAELVVEIPLFASSYAPLFLILAIRFERVWLEIVCGALAAVGFGVALFVFARYRSLTADSWRVTHVEDRGPEVAGYLAAYLLPFVAVPEPTWRDIAGYGIFLLVAGVIYVRSAMIQINPTLYLFGWRLAEVTVNDAWPAYLLFRRSEPEGGITAVRMTERLLVEAPNGGAADGRN
jgi:hypothetical protein